MSEHGDCLVLNLGSAQLTVWYTTEGHLSSHTAVTPAAVATQLYPVDGLRRFEAVAQVLQTICAPLFLSASSRVVLLTNADDSPYFWSSVAQWITQNTSCLCTQVRQMPCALFTAHVLAMPTGTVIDIGHRATRVVPVCDGFLVASCVHTTVGMGLVAAVSHEHVNTLLEEYLDLQSAPAVHSEQPRRTLALPFHTSLTDVVALVDGIQEAIEATVIAVKRSGVAACLSHVVITGGGANCASLRDIVCCHLHALAPQARVCWE